VSPAERGSPSALSRLTVKFGLWALLAYLTLGLGLEGLHGFKVPWYLEFETRRLMWTLAHAHGVLVSVLVIGFGLMLQVQGGAAEGWTRIAGACLMASAVLLPGGFLLGGIYVFDGDPGPGVLLSPVGGGLLFTAVALAAIRYRATDAANTGAGSENRQDT
jgi:hypothetical protein